MTALLCYPSFACACIDNCFDCCLNFTNFIEFRLFSEAMSRLALAMVGFDVDSKWSFGLQETRKFVDFDSFKNFVRLKHWSLCFDLAY